MTRVIKSVNASLLIVKLARTILIPAIPAYRVIDRKLTILDYVAYNGVCYAILPGCIVYDDYNNSMLTCYACSDTFTLTVDPATELGTCTPCSSTMPSRLRCKSKADDYESLNSLPSAT